ncbi:MAG TPA: hypothetical protein VNE18_08210 [Rhodanobacter sp.]|nr:hypothetical protein [Rhodanobacter sp.]
MPASQPEPTAIRAEAAIRAIDPAKQPDFGLKATSHRAQDRPYLVKANISYDVFALTNIFVAIECAA